MQTETTFAPLVFNRRNYSDALLLELYEAILLPRMIEEKMLILLRQGKVSKWFSGIGQEAISVGVTKGLDSSDYILPLHRNLGVFTGRNLELKKLFCQWQGKKYGYTKGRDRSFHFGTPEHRVIGMISHLGAMLGVADGISLASNLDKDTVISVAFSGDGGASEGDFHEAINTAAVWELPVIFLVENNGYGLSTPSNEQFRCKQFIDKAIGYGIEGIQVDGNNILDVYEAVTSIAEKMRKDRKPVILECMTFRMRGHEEASGTKYVPKELFEQWEIKDPVKNYERFLEETGVLTPTRAVMLKERIKNQLAEAWEQTFAEPEIVANIEEELKDVYAPFVHELTLPSSGGSSQTKRLVDAVSDGLRQGLEKDPGLIIMGQDIAEYGGVFKVTDQFHKDFGKERIRNTPLCESAILGSALGLSIRGRASVVEMQFADFVTCGFNQIINNLSKTHYRWNQAVNVTVRMPSGAGVGAGPFHSQSNEAWFFHTPGLKVVYPSNPYDAKGLLTTSLLDPNPVIFFEHKYLYRSVESEVPDGYYNLPLGKGNIVSKGEDITVVTYGWGVSWCMEVQKMLPEVSLEIIDLRTLLPWDEELVFESVKNTGKCIVVHEDCLTGGIGGEIAATISEKCFKNLDAPVMRVGSLDTPVPFSNHLEQQFLGKRILADKIKELSAF
jgi:2-oxoisovalerate dehydrogenase E1 component